MRLILISFYLIFISISCGKKKQINLQIPEEKLVSIIIDLYAAKATANQNHIDYKDSTSLVYLEQISKIYGYTQEQIKSDLDILYQHRDSLISLQNRALDTLRAMNEKQYQQQFQNPLSTGTINN